MKVGFIGQGFIGKNYSDDLEERGHEVIRYSLDPWHAANRDLIRDCRVVFVAVPTPTTPTGFDLSAVREAVSLCGPGSIVVIKSTVLPGSTCVLQREHPDKTVIHSPEFLTEATAASDARNPKRNIVGFVCEDGRADERRAAAETVLSLLPPAPYCRVCTAEEAEAVKYGGNIFFVFKVMFMNTLYDLCKAKGIDYQTVIEAMRHDPRIGDSHLEAEHSGGRGAGGHCFIKDLAAYVDDYAETFADRDGHYAAAIDLLRTVEEMNRRLLTETGKSLDIMEQVYGITGRGLGEDSSEGD
jgi:UDPglucose 6-dehydrogenase